MKRALGIAVVLSGLLGGGVFADRADVWSGSTVAVFQVELKTLADGGCSAQAWATYSTTDGGRTVAEPSRQVALAGANRTACLDVLTRAHALFVADKEL